MRLCLLCQAFLQVTALCLLLGYLVKRRSCCLLALMATGSAQILQLSTVVS